MRKRFFATFPAIALGMAALVSCSNSDDFTADDNTNSGTGEGITFALTASNWDDAAAQSRSAGDNLPTAPAVSQLGNGVSASASLVRTNVTKAATRATTSALNNNTNYTIIAYNNATGAEAGRMTGKWLNSKMVFADATTKEAKMILPDGTYTFVCFNDKLTESAGNLMPVNAQNSTYDAALVARHIATIAGNNIKIPLHLTHPYARFKVKIVGVGLDKVQGLASVTYYTTDQANPITISYANTGFYSTTMTGNDNSKNGIVAIKAIDGSAASTATISTALDFAQISNITNSSTDKNSENYLTDWLNSYQSSAAGSSAAGDYIYVPGGTDPAAFKIKFGEPDDATGKNKVYGISLKDKEMALAATSGAKMAANGTYTYRIYLSYDYKYLFSDGTVGTLAQYWTTKTPIAVVTSTKNKTAMALKEVADYQLWSTSAAGPHNATSANGLTYPSADFFQITDGYETTYDPAYSADATTIKATSDAYPAFKAAASYDPGVPLTGTLVKDDSNLSNKVGKWYLPSFGEFRTMYQSLGKGTFVNASTYTKETEFNDKTWYHWNGLGVVLAVMQAGGTTLNYHYNTSTEGVYRSNYVTGRFQVRVNNDLTISNSKNYMAQPIGVSATNAGAVRPFIHYQ